MIVAMTVIMILLALYLITITFYLVCQIRVPSNPSYKIHDMVKHGCKKACYMTGICRLDKDAAWSNLLIVTQSMVLENIPYVLSEGTALGLIRDGDIIDYDDDVDMVVPKEHKSRFMSEVMPVLLRRGFATCKSWRQGDLLTLCRRGVSVDINFIARDTSCEWGPSGNIFPCPVDSILTNTREMTFHGRQLTLPSDDYLEIVYGSSWRVPKHRLACGNDNAYNLDLL